MAEELDDGEFWLPSEFLADDIFMEEKKRKEGIENGSGVYFPCEFPYEFDSFGSALSSPVESVVGSTETESDEEDYMAGLSRQMAHCMLQDAEKISSPAHGNENPKTRVMAGSPQSTLCAVGCWSGRSLGSNRGNPNGTSQLPSPPSKTFDRKGDAWDLLYAAAGQVVRMRVNDEGQKFHGQGLLSAPRKHMAPEKSPPVGFYPNQALTQQQLQNARFQELKQQQLLKQQAAAAWGRQGKAMPAMQQQQLQNSARAVGFDNGRYIRPLGLSSSAWPPLQQQRQTGSGMRAVFLGNSGSKRESCGTGVFLPRRAGNPAEPRKKTACSTVLLPARVVQALNLNLDEMGTAHPRFQESNAVARNNITNNNHHHNNNMISQQKRSSSSSSIRYHPATNHENLLPQEWTY
ncbi:uncharacterized protein LOC131243863 isoform X2 [Magnolia sinica]|uniref:uncharacterized protein LOC131243863 isoform X2 n=1 Tax=Magnolia sinica TaxID=86752 RepID=UPI0026598865|nr:uncharacterized protein LOC131243863 isoform X2 [Magnolia sinica]